MPATRARQGVYHCRGYCADYPSCSAQYQFVLLHFLAKCVGSAPRCPGGGEVPYGLLVPHFILLLLLKFYAQCLYECSTGLEC